MDLDTLDEDIGDPVGETRAAGDGRLPRSRTAAEEETWRWRQWDWSWYWWDCGSGPREWNYSTTAVQGPGTSNGVTSSSAQAEPGGRSLARWQGSLGHCGNCTHGYYVNQFPYYLLT